MRGLGLDHSRSWLRGDMYTLLKLCHTIQRFLSIPWHCSDLKNVTVINRAVIDHNDQVTLIWRDNNGKNLTGLTHVAGLAEDKMDAITIKGTTVDSFIASQTITSPVAFVKCDVEGAELLVVRGAVNMIEKYRPIFYLEVESSHCLRYGYKPKNLFDFFQHRKYSAYTITGSNLFKVDKSIYSGQGDVLFVPAEKYF